MAKESDYLDSLEEPDLYLDSPLPVELNGRPGNWVATWMETRIEGEGITREHALNDFRRELLVQYRRIDSLLKANNPLSDDDESKWTSMCHYIGSVNSGTRMPGTEFAEPPGSKDYKGPIFG